MLYLSLAAILIVMAYFSRYIPTIGVRCVDSNTCKQNDVHFVDVRDYNQSYKQPIKEATNIPTAYLRRFYKEIPNGKIVVIASDLIEKNLSVRFLKRKGFDVIGYSITNCKCKEKFNVVL